MNISFGIKTHLRNEYKTLLTIRSILAQNLEKDHFEILITGNTRFSCLAEDIQQHVTLIPDEEAARHGRLASMMNTLAASARYDHICLMDDDILLLDGWYQKLLCYNEASSDYDVLAFPVMNTNGSRYWDWAMQEEDSGTHRLLLSHEKPSSLYVTGGLVLFKKEVWQNIKWDNTKGFYECEDVDWSRRVLQHGYIIQFCRNAFALHNDWRYYQKNLTVTQYKNMFEAFRALPPGDGEAKLLQVQKELFDVQHQLAETKYALEWTQRSSSYLLGRFLTFPFRKIRDWVKKLQLPFRVQ